MLMQLSWDHWGNCSRSAVPKLFVTRELFHGRQFLHGLGLVGVVLVLPVTHLLLCGLVPNRTWTGTIPWLGGGNPCPKKLLRDSTWLLTLYWDIPSQSLVSRVPAAGKERGNGDLTAVLKAVVWPWEDIDSDSQWFGQCLSHGPAVSMKVVFYGTEKEAKYVWWELKKFTLLSKKFLLGSVYFKVRRGGRVEIPHVQGKRNPNEKIGAATGHQRADTLRP